MEVSVPAWGFVFVIKERKIMETEIIFVSVPAWGFVFVI